MNTGTGSTGIQKYNSSLRALDQQGPNNWLGRSRARVPLWRGMGYSMAPDAATSEDSTQCTFKHSLHTVVHTGISLPPPVPSPLSPSVTLSRTSFQSFLMRHSKSSEAIGSPSLLPPPQLLSVLLLLSACWCPLARPNGGIRPWPCALSGQTGLNPSDNWRRIRRCAAMVKEDASSH